MTAYYTIAADGSSITCTQCGSTSHNLLDVRERYCGRCKQFHDDRAREDYFAQLVAERDENLVRWSAMPPAERARWPQVKE